MRRHSHLIILCSSLLRAFLGCKYLTQARASAKIMPKCYAYESDRLCIVLYVISMSITCFLETSTFSTAKSEKCPLTTCEELCQYYIVQLLLLTLLGW